MIESSIKKGQRADVEKSTDSPKKISYENQLNSLQTTLFSVKMHYRMTKFLVSAQERKPETKRR